MVLSCAVVAMAAGCGGEEPVDEDEIEQELGAGLVDKVMLDAQFPFWRLGKVWVDKPSAPFARPMYSFISSLMH